MNDSTLASILYIEDDPGMIDLVQMILGNQGYQVQGAFGGNHALEILGLNLPDLILLDLMMPDFDGWDLYHRLKSDPHTASIPVIIITAKSQPIDKVLGIHIARVDDYICKPFHPQDLIESVRRVLETKNSKD